MSRPAPPHGGRTTFLGVLGHHDAAGTPFATIRGGGRVADVARPLLVVVHPGDLVEPTPGGCAEAATAFRYGAANQAGTARDVAAALSLGWDLAVLHRGSCSQFRPAHRWVDGRLGAVLRRAWAVGWVAFGDDLDAAARWLDEGPLAAARPRVGFAGAYSSPGHGCLTRLATHVLARAPDLRVSVSRHSPGGNAEGDEVWRPGRPAMSHAEARALPDAVGA